MNFSCLLIKKSHVRPTFPVILLFCIFISLPVPVVAGLDYPHSEVTSIGCKSCHDVASPLPMLMPPWTSHPPVDIDDTSLNSMCWSCHNSIDAPYVKTHSSLQTGNSYGNWTVECWVCHNQHIQDQMRTFGSAAYFYSAASSAIATTTITQTGAGWAVNQFAGLVVIPNVLEIDYSYKILSNTESMLTVQGPMNPAYVVSGDTFAVIYGKLITSSIDLGDITTDPPGLKTGVRDVKFFGATGPNSLADGDATYDGLCEVCHTQTNYFRNDGSGSTHFGAVAGTACVECHSHDNGFAHGGGADCIECHGHDAGTLYDPDMMAGPVTPGIEASQGKGSFQSHSTHTETYVDDLKGPGIYCSDCHDIDNLPSFKSGTDANGDGRYNLAETDVCNTCHSSGGTYDGIDDPVVGAKTIWKTGAYVATNDSTLSADKEKWCATCHDEMASVISSVTAPNVIGDEDGSYTYGSGWGYYKTGHGLVAGEQFPSKGGVETLSGRPVKCDSCHDYATAHIDGAARTFDDGDVFGLDPAVYRQGYRLKLIDGQEPYSMPRPSNIGTSADQFRVCFQIGCHDSGPFTDDANMNTNLVTDGINRHTYHLLFNNEEMAAADWSGAYNSRMTCVVCHNVHGSTRLAWYGTAS